MGYCLFGNRLTLEVDYASVVQYSDSKAGYCLLGNILTVKEGHCLFGNILTVKVGYCDHACQIILSSGS